MRKFLLISSFCLIVLQVSCNFGSRIKGQVLDAQNNPVEGAEVKFVVFKGKLTETFESETKAATVTGKNGEFEVPVTKENPEKILSLIVQKNGYKLVGTKFTARDFEKHPEVYKDFKIFLEKK